MVTLGWLHDDIGITGGAEISSNAILDNKPPWVEEVVLCRPGLRPPKAVDAYVVTNCLTYGQVWIQELAKRPVVKVCRDTWPLGDVTLRRWLLANARVAIFGSVPLIDNFPWSIKVPAVAVPSPVNLDRFKAAALPVGQRTGNVFLGRIDPGKGAALAIEWAMENAKPLDLYGTVSGFVRFGQLPPDIRLMGPVSYGQVPAILGQAKQFVFFPQGFESCSRVTIEAWAAGCELVTDQVNNAGALDWINTNPKALEFSVAINLFWETIRRAVDE